MYTKHPQPDQPHPKTPLSWPELESEQNDKINYSLGKVDSNWAKCLKCGKTFLEVGKQNLFIVKVSSTAKFLYSWTFQKCHFGFRNATGWWPLYSKPDSEATAAHCCWTGRAALHCRCSPVLGNITLCGSDTVTARVICCLHHKAGRWWYFNPTFKSFFPE